MIETLNCLEEKLGNIFNAYVQAPVTEKVWTTLGTEFVKMLEGLQWLLEPYMASNQQEQSLEATLQSAWNPLAIGLVRLTQIYGSNQKSDKKMG